MTTAPEPLPIDDNALLLRRIRRSETTRDQANGPERPSSDAYKQDGAEGEISVYLLSETTPERITSDYPDVYVAVVGARLLRQIGLEVERSAVEGESGH